MKNLKEDFNEVYQVIDGKWTMGGLQWGELSLKEKKALGEHVSYYFKTG